MNSFEWLDTSAFDALFSGKIQGIAALCYENERPLQGLAGDLDWRFHGLLSFYLRQGAIIGAPGERVYIPVQKHDRTYHLFLIGAGHSEYAGHRAPPPDEAIQSLREVISSLKINHLGVSRSDLGLSDKNYLKDIFKGVPACLVQ